MNRVDNHSHIMRAPILDMILAAEANHIVELSITEHISQFRDLRESVSFGSRHSSGRIFESVEEYASEFRSVPTKEAGTKVNRGLEVDFIRRYETQIADFVNQAEWDILLCSIHEFQDGKDVETSFEKLPDPNLLADKWHEYFHLQTMALESNFVPFKVLAHPVRMSRGIVTPPPDFDNLLLKLADTARKNGRALELNGSDIGYAPQLVRQLAIACSRAGCMVSLGSDAHSPRDVFRNMKDAVRLVKELNLQPIRIETKVKPDD